MNSIEQAGPEHSRNRTTCGPDKSSIMSRATCDSAATRPFFAFQVTLRPSAPS